MILTKMRPISRWEDLGLVINLQQASILLGVSIEYLKKLSQQGIFPAFKIGKEWKITKDDLLAFIEERKKINERGKQK